jgi:hypothetical protein
MIRHRFVLWLMLWLLPVAALAVPPRLAGVFPAVASPGSTVTVIGGPFEAQTLIAFGDRLLQPTNLAETQLTFIVPQRPEGDYLLYLQTGQELSARSLFFRVTRPTPRILALDPATMDACSRGARRQVTVQARDLPSGGRVLLDGVAQTAERSGDFLTFVLPDLAPGMHQVQLADPDGRYSLPVALLVDHRPEIQSVAPGEQYVNYYELLIEGKNFLPTSTLLVDGRPVTPFPSGSLQVDNITCLDCNALLYRRYPVSGQARPITLRVINPDGQQSADFSFTTP